MTELILPRRTILKGLAALLAAPAIVRIDNLMPVKAMRALIPERDVIYVGPIRTFKTIQEAINYAYSRPIGTPTEIRIDPGDYWTPIFPADLNVTLTGSRL
jgi:pectin methylesterase-like acyl-CoA thioesterase